MNQHESQKGRNVMLLFDEQHQFIATPGGSHKPTGAKSGAIASTLCFWAFGKSKHTFD